MGHSLKRMPLNCEKLLVTIRGRQKNDAYPLSTFLYLSDFRKGIEKEMKKEVQPVS